MVFKSVKASPRANQFKISTTKFTPSFRAPSGCRLLARLPCISGKGSGIARWAQARVFSSRLEKATQSWRDRLTASKQRFQCLHVEALAPGTLRSGRKAADNEFRNLPPSRLRSVLNPPEALALGLGFAAPFGSGFGRESRFRRPGWGFGFALWFSLLRHSK